MHSKFRIIARYCSSLGATIHDARHATIAHIAHAHYSVERNLGTLELLDSTLLRRFGHPARMSLTRITIVDTAPKRHLLAADDRGAVSGGCPRTDSCALVVVSARGLRTKAAFARF